MYVRPTLHPYPHHFIPSSRNVLVYSPDYYLLHLLVIKRVTNAGTICGCDWSGYVVETGKSVTSLSVGDHVAGFVQGGTYTDRGAYAEYVKTPAELAWRVPDGTLSHEEAATMGCGSVLNVVGLGETDEGDDGIGSGLQYKLYSTLHGSH